MKRKLIAALMAMTLTLSCGVTALAEEPSEGETEISQVGNGEDEDEGKVEREGIVPNDSANPSKDDTVVTKDSLKEIEEKDTEKPNPAADGEDTAEQELPIDEAHFPDANFREYIKDKIDLDGNGSLSQEEIIAVEEISLSSTNGKVFSDVSGVEYFINLKEFSCFDCQLTSLDLSKNLKLERLVCSKNQLTNLDVSQNLELDTLQAWGNRLTSLDVSNNRKLTFLVCGKNPLAKLDVSNLTSLELLDCGECWLTNLNLNDNKELVELDCAGNQLISLDIRNTALYALWCADNQLRNLQTNSKLIYLECDGNTLSNLDLTNETKMTMRDDEKKGGGVAHHGELAGAYVTPQTLSRTVKSVNGVWTLDMASIVGKSYLDRVTLATEGAKMSKDGLVTFQGSEAPKELVYHFDTKNPAETTLMEVTVALSGVNDQTKEEVSVDTSGMDIDSICKDNNVSPDNAEIVVSQETPSKENSDKLAGEATSKGLKVTATYEILLKLFSQGNEIAQITENFGNVTLTLQAGKDYAGHKAVIFQLHNGQVIEHDGLTVKADGTVTITVDKFSTFAVAVSEEKDSNIEKPGQTPGTANPPTANPKPVSTDNKNKTTGAGSVKTGDETNIVYWMVLGMIALGVCGFFGRKKFYRG